MVEKKLSLFALAVSFALTLGSAAAQTPQRLTPQSREQISLSFAPVVKQAAPAVVNIYTKKRVREQAALSPLLNDPFFRQFFGDRLPVGPSRERVQNSLGSGVILRADGLVVTNFHVIKGADEISVVLADRREFDAKLVRSDERVDLAVLKIDAGKEVLPVLPLIDSDQLQVGDLVLAIGNPFGVGQTVTQGIVSALARTNAGITDYNFFIQTDAAINPGNSGGALVTMDGRLAGINTAIYSRSGGSIGIGFAIPANMVRTVLSDDAARNGKIVRAWFGGSGQPVTPDVAASLGLSRPSGVLIAEVHPESPAAQAGIRAGDVITAFNGNEVPDPESLRFRIATQPIGETASFTLLRRGQTVTASAKLIAPPETPKREATLLKGQQPLAGATIANLSPALVEEMGIPGPSRGVILVDIVARSPAARVGFQPGDLLQQVNGTQIASVGDAVAALGRGQTWRITIKRGDEVLTDTFGKK
jgi:serine protease Do